MFSEEIQQFENNYNNGNTKYLAHSHFAFLDRKVGSNTGVQRIAGAKSKTQLSVHVVVPDKHQQDWNRVDHYDVGLVCVCPH